MLETCGSSSLQLAARRSGAGSLAALMLLAAPILCCLPAKADPDPQAAVCHMRVRVWLTPDVPDPSGSGFLSSLAGRPGYVLTWLSESKQDMSVTLELSGPGPEYRCRREIERVRRDARVIDLKVLPLRE